MSANFLIEIHFVLSWLYQQSKMDGRQKLIERGRDSAMGIDNLGADLNDTPIDSDKMKVKAVEAEFLNSSKF